MVDYGNGDGNGNGYYGNGNGDGDGDGDGNGYYGNGNGDGDGDGYGYGYGYGNGYGYGDGYGYGYGYGDSYGDSYGSGYGYGDSYGEVDHKTPFITWHIVQPNGQLRLQHWGNQPKVKPGLILTWDQPLKMCSAGLHASFDLADAKKYGGDGVVTKVACSGRVLFQEDKLCCSRREVLEVFPAGYTGD
jgi:hypothetical protein